MDFDGKGQLGLSFSLEEALLWIMNAYFGKKLKCLDGFVSYKHAAELESLLVDYYDVFLSAVLTLILTAPIHCRGSTIVLKMKLVSFFIRFGEMYHLHFGWPEGGLILS